MSHSSQVLLIDAAPGVTPQLDARLRERGLRATRVSPARFNGGAMPTASLAVVLIDPDTTQPDGATIRALLEGFVKQDVSTIVWGGNGAVPRVGSPLIEYLSSDVGLDELVGKVGTLVRYAPLVQGLERELQTLQRLGQQLNRHFGDLDQEMRLAGRLQRDFLPRQLPDLPPFSFNVLYRPASWVSGDMYDVFRIDENHIGVFIADAMGHGVAAGLLTMFLRQALVPKRVGRNSYAIVRPAAALRRLHRVLVRQQLPNCHFVTAAYAIADIRTRQVRMARAGHPYPIHVRTDGSVAEVPSGGSLLGLPDVPTDFEEVRLRLEPGERLIFYTDGLEDTLLVPRTNDRDCTTFTDHLKTWAPQPGGKFIQSLEAQLDCAEGSINPHDDMTLLLLNVADDA